MKVTADNFVWKLVTIEQAEFIFSLDLFPLYALYEDDSESLIENYDEIKEYTDNGCSLGIEVGFIIK
jgi:hypothetical protein